MNSLGDRSPRKAKGQGSERREEILAAALKLFTEFGVYSVSTRQIAEAVGVSQPTLYAYFPTKDDIGRELHSRAFEALAARLTSHIDQWVETPADFAAMLRTYIDFGLENPDLYRMAFMAEAPQVRLWTNHTHAIPTPALASTYGTLLRMITDLHRRGLVVETAPAVTAQAVWTAMHGLVALLISKPGFPWVDRDALIDGHLEMIGRGIWRTSIGHPSIA